jgi:hypothetical protein
VVLLAVLVFIQVVSKKLSGSDDKEVTMSHSKMAVPVVVAMAETGWAIGASYAANAVSA